MRTIRLKMNKGVAHLTLDRPEALAVGMGIASACDVVVAARSAYFALTEVRIGLVPAFLEKRVPAWQAS
jgi:methylglutaconyl-CoA hydratase